MKTLKAPSPLRGQTSDVRNAVAALLENIEREGWEAVLRLSRELDGFTGPFRVPDDHLAACEASLPSDVREAVLLAAANVRAFHRRQRELLKDSEWEIAPGVRAGMRFLPIDRIAVYVPGGRHPLPSSAVMGVVPAQEAAVPRIAAFSPPRGEGGVHPVVLGTLSLLGVTEVWALGGAQAIAAAALGLGPVERVDLIVGPGNAYVTEAKRLFAGDVGIDGLAGPSEVLVVADRTADPERIAADLLAQAEHDPLAKSTLLALDEKTARAVAAAVERLLPTLATANVARASWEANGTVAVCSLDEAAAEAKRVAPEHLELALEDPRAVLHLFPTAGAIFLGHASAEAFGDYVAGTNHILPTEGRARFAGGVWTGTFLRPVTHLELSPEGAVRLAAAGEIFARAEGLAAHEAALRARRSAT